MSDQLLTSITNNRPDFMRGRVDMTLRKRVRLAFIRQYGQMKMNCSGEDSRHQIKISKPPTQGYVDGQPINYANHQSNRRIRLPWRGILSSDSMSLFQQMQNTGENQLINTFEDKANAIMDALDEDFHTVSLGDGDAGAQNLPHGLETFLTYLVAGAADTIARPNDSYGLDSLSTVLAGLGGTWSDSGGGYQNATLANDYPNGQGSREYDANSPLFLNYNTSTGWGTGSATWETNCWRVLSAAITWMGVNNGAEGQPTNAALGKDLFLGYKNHHEPMRRIAVPHQTANDLGLNKDNDVLNQDGVAIHSEFDIAAGVGYVENMRTVELRSLAPELFWLIHSYERVGGQLSAFMDLMDMRQLGMLMLGGFFGQMCYKPKYVCKVGDLTT